MNGAGKVQIYALGESLREWVKRAAFREGVSMSTFVARAIEGWRDDAARVRQLGFSSVKDLCAAYRGLLKGREE